MDNFIEFAATLNPYLVFVQWSVFFAIHVILLKKHFFSIADPLLLFCLFNSFSFCVVANVSIIELNYSYIIDFTIFNSLFFLGFLSRRKCIRFYETHVQIQRLDNRTSKLYFFILFLILFLATISLWIIRGIPLFSDNPGDAKVLLYENGFGFVKYIHGIIPPVLVFCSLYGLLKKDGSHFYRSILWVYFGFSVLIYSFSASRSNFIQIVFILAFISKLFEVASIPSSNSILILRIAFVAALVSMFYLFSLSGDDVINEFAVRLIASGDIYFFWYSNSLFETLQKFDGVGFFYYLVNPFLAMAGLVPQGFSLGPIIMNEATGYPLSGFGPNAQLPVVLGFYLWYLKYIIGFLFGYFMSAVRTSSYKLLKRFGVLGFSFMIILFLNATTLYVDISYFLSIIFVAIFLLTPVYILSRLLTNP